MAALAERASEGIAPPRHRKAAPLGVSIWRWVVLLVTAAYFLIPLWAALRFAGIGAFGSVVSEAGFTSSHQTFPVWIYVNSQTSGQVSVAASLLALFVTWVFLLAITVLGSRQSRKTGGGEVTLFTVARTETRGDR